MLAAKLVQCQVRQMRLIRLTVVVALIKDLRNILCLESCCVLSCPLSTARCVAPGAIRNSGEELIGTFVEK